MPCFKNVQTIGKLRRLQL